MEIVSFMSPLIRGDCNTESFPAYIMNEHIQPLIYTYNSFVFFIPNCEDFKGRYCMKERCPFHKVSDSSTEMFW
jgi:hypothetical protein